MYLKKQILDTCEINDLSWNRARCSAEGAAVKFDFASLPNASK